MIARRTPSLLLLALAFFPGIAESQGTGSQSSQTSQDKRPPDLSGKWKTEDGRQVIIGQIGKHLYATFPPGNDKCANGGTLSYLFNADLSGPSWTSLKGTMTACTQDPKLVTDCGWSKVWETTFEATAALDKISGKVLIMGVSGGTENGHYVNCHVDHRYDIQQKFVLTLDCDAKIAALRRDEEEAQKEAARRLAHSAALMRERTEEGVEDYRDLWKELGIEVPEHISMEKIIKGALLDKLSTPTSDLDAALRTQQHLEYAERAMIAAQWALLAKLVLKVWMVMHHLEGMYDDAQKESARGGELLQRSVADFKEILDLLAACKKQREKEEKKLRDLEDLNDRAHKLRDEWDLGTGLYRDGSGQIYDAGGALNHARQILVSGQSSYLREGASHFRIQLATFTQAGTQQETTVTVQQLSDALAEIRRASSLFSQGMDKLIQAATVDKDIQAGLDDLVSRLGAGPVASSAWPTHAWTQLRPAQCPLRVQDCAGHYNGHKRQVQPVCFPWPKTARYVSKHISVS